MKINYLQVYDYNLNISKRLNECIGMLPNEWICLTDQDTLKFEQFPKNLKRLLENQNKSFLIGTHTNRLNPNNPQVIKEYYEEKDIDKHNQLALDLWQSNTTKLKNTTLIAGVCMIFHKSLWDKVGGFREDKTFFDRYFSKDVIENGGECKIATGLYVFHLYRWGSKDPVSDVKHLVKK